MHQLVLVLVDTRLSVDRCAANLHLTSICDREQRGKHLENAKNSIGPSMLWRPPELSRSKHSLDAHPGDHHLVLLLQGNDLENQKQALDLEN